MELSLYTYIFLSAAAFLSGFVDSIAGGGGTIAIPALLTAGIPPHLAIATNKLQSSFGVVTAVTNFKRKGLFEFKDLTYGILFTILGAIIGATSIHFISASFLKPLSIIMLSIVFLFLLLNRKLGEEDRHKRVKEFYFYIIFGLTLGFYDGFFGPGTGSFWTIALVLLLGLNLKKASIHTRVLNMTSNLTSLCIFIFSSAIIWKLGFIMAIFQVIGAYTGSSIVAKVNIKFIKIFFMSVVFVIILKLIYDNFIS